LKKQENVSPVLHHKESWQSDADSGVKFNVYSNANAHTISSQAKGTND